MLGIASRSSVWPAFAEREICLPNAMWLQYRPVITEVISDQTLASLIRAYQILDMQRERFVLNGAADGLVPLTRAEAAGLTEMAETIKELRPELEQ